MSHSQPGYPPYITNQQSGGYCPPPGYPQPQPGCYAPPPQYPPPGPNYGPTINTQPVPGHMAQPGHMGMRLEYSKVEKELHCNIGQNKKGWMNIPSMVPVNCPNGLQYLTTVDQLLVKQKVELLEAFIGFETNNKYTIKNSQGQKVFYAVEDTDCCTRLCCGSIRPFTLKIMDNYKNEIIILNRELACDTCWFPCCLQKLQVCSPPGNLIGSVEQTWSICTPEFDVKNEHGDVVLKIEGPICRFGICGDVEFKVLSKDKSCVVGRISKRWSGLMREMFTDSDYFGITFPLDLDVRMKAVMLGACFLIDFMYFEKTGNRENDGIGLC